LAEDTAEPVESGEAVQPRNVIVVGGGVAGLVTARRLAIAGFPVTLLEASDHLGGTVARHTVAGVDLDAGAESFATRGGTVAKLASELGLADAIVQPNPEGAWLQPATGRAFRLPANSLLGIPGSPLAKDVIDIIGFGAAMRAFLEILLPGSYAAKSATLGELVRKRMGPAVLDKLVNPIVRGVHSTDADKLPVNQVAPGLVAAMKRRGSLATAVLEQRDNSARAGSAVAGIRGGINRLVEELAADLDRFGVDIRLNARAGFIESDSVIANGRRLNGLVIVAAPGLLGGEKDAGTRVTLATLVVREPALDAAPRGTGVLVAEGAAGIRARALTHATAKWHWLAERAEGKQVLRLSYDTAGDDLAEIARQDASALLGVDIAPENVLGFDRVAWYRPKRETHTPNGILATGESIAGTGLASVIAHAEAIAADVIRDQSA
jgi:oxygen-dependent protoporphyrinogen oxidase